MLNLKSIFVPPDSASTPQNSMEAAQQNVGPTPQKPIRTGFNGAKTRMFLGAAFLFLTLLGGASAFYLSTTGQDLRQQAAEIPGYGKDCSGFTTKEGQAYCGSTAINSCLKCERGIGVSNPGGCTGLPCDPNSQFNQPTCSGGARPGQEACAGTTNDTCQLCTRFLPNGNINQSPQAKWVPNEGGCKNLVCSGQATPTPGGAVATCASIGQTPGTPSCGSINADGCYQYKSCHTGSNYNACTPNAGTNTCTYSMTGGAKCTAPCPATVAGTGTSRCECGNGQWTIGVIPPGGSCAQLCSCTGNTCKDCQPSKPPQEKPSPTPTKQLPSPTPTQPPGQCINIKMLTPDGKELTGDDDKTLKPGDAVKFMCAGNGKVDKYEFRVVMPDGSVQTATNNPALAAVGATTGNFILPAVGKFTPQCRICTIPTCPPGQTCPTISRAPVCQDYETVPGILEVNLQSCGGAQGLTCPTGYSCDTPGGAPDAMGKCVETAPKSI